MSVLQRGEAVQEARLILQRAQVEEDRIVLDSADDRDRQVAKGLGEAAALHDPLAPLGLGPLLVVEAQRLAGVGIDPPPPADERREGVGGGGGERIARVGVGAP